jgi:bacterioferritin-associated ferredoxin
MYVCICNAVTDSQVRAAVDAGHDSLKALRTHLGVGDECGRCSRYAADLLADCKACGRCERSNQHTRDHSPAHSHPDVIQAAFA